MRAKRIATCLFSALLLLLLCASVAQADKSKKSPKASKPMTLQSEVFSDGAQIPMEYGCKPDGNFKKASPPLNWTNAPQGTKSFVILMDDPAEVAKYWVHWVAVDIPAETSSLPKGASGKRMPLGSKELQNTFETLGYGGPCPPDKAHSYRIRIYAMPTEKTDLTVCGKRGDELNRELEKLALAHAQLTGSYPKK